MPTMPTPGETKEKRRAPPAPGREKRRAPSPPGGYQRSSPSLPDESASRQFAPLHLPGEEYGRAASPWWEETNRQYAPSAEGKEKRKAPLPPGIEKKNASFPPGDDRSSPSIPDEETRSVSSSVGENRLEASFSFREKNASCTLSGRGKRAAPLPPEGESNVSPLRSRKDKRGATLPRCREKRCAPQPPVQSQRSVPVNKDDRNLGFIHDRDNRRTPSPSLEENGNPFLRSSYKKRAAPSPPTFRPELSSGEDRGASPSLHTAPPDAALPPNEDERGSTRAKDDVDADVVLPVAMETNMCLFTDETEVGETYIDLEECKSLATPPSEEDVCNKASTPPAESGMTLIEAEENGNPFLSSTCENRAAPSPTTSSPKPSDEDKDALLSPHTIHLTASLPLNEDERGSPIPQDDVDAVVALPVVVETNQCIFTGETKAEETSVALEEYESVPTPPLEEDVSNRASTPSAESEMSYITPEENDKSLQVQIVAPTEERQHHRDPSPTARVYVPCRPAPSPPSPSTASASEKPKKTKCLPSFGIKNSAFRLSKKKKRGKKPAPGTPTSSSNKSSLPPRPGPGHPLYNKYMGSEPHGIALFDYQGQEADELSFKTDDVIILVKRIDSDWLVGKCNGKEGMFPTQFIRIVKDLNEASGSEYDGPLAVALYSFQASAPDEVSFEEGDNIKLLGTVGTVWFRGEVKGKTGIFPSNHVEVIIPLPSSSPSREGGSGPRCIAKFEYSSSNADDLQFSEGAVIKLIQRVANEWYRGELDGKSGIFPAAFVDVVEDLPLPGVGSSPPSPTTGNEVRALFDFDGADSTELSLKEGDKVRVTAQVGSEWLEGEVNGKKGRFPANFVDRVPTGLPQAADPRLQNSGIEPHCVVSFDFDAQNDDEINLKAGEKITLLERIGDDWLRGKIDSREGIFPRSFVDVIIDLPSASATASEGKALYDFVAEADDELSFKTGEVIKITERVNDEWLQGTLNGKSGRFPAAFVALSS